EDSLSRMVFFNGYCKFINSGEYSASKATSRDFYNEKSNRRRRRKQEYNFRNDANTSWTKRETSNIREYDGYEKISRMTKRVEEWIIFSYSLFVYDHIWKICQINYQIVKCTQD